MYACAMDLKAAGISEFLPKAEGEDAKAWSGGG